MFRRPDIAEIFNTALDLPLDERKAFIAGIFPHDQARCDEVESLLKAYADARKSDFLSENALEIEAQHLGIDDEPDHRIGDMFGRYRIVRRIGSGGMGAIYLAVRTDDYEKQAAIKIIKRGMDSETILKRFRNERQILANLEHPNIAHLIDGGTTDDGLPFFVMEYVDGLTISECCEAYDEKEILLLFRKVCSAVSFAHQKLIVHRDLKPSNILVNSEGEAKLLDFGIAKLLAQPGGEETQAINRILTPAYAAPEQIRGEMAATSSDVYSLGKILAELLGKTENKRRHLDADLKNILSKSVEEEIECRYPSVDAFSHDIQRYLDGLPVLARHASKTYRARKFIQRNKAKVAVVMLFGLTLAGGVTATLWKASEANRERELAEKRFENLRRLSDSFVTELHAAIQNLPGSLPARQLLLQRAVEQLDTLSEESGGDPALKADLATGYFNLASLPDLQIAAKEDVLRKVCSIYLNLLAIDPNHAQYSQALAKGYIELADVRKVRGSVADGLTFSKAAVSIVEDLVRSGPREILYLEDLRDSYSNLANFYLETGEGETALEVSRRSSDLNEEISRSKDVTQGDGFLFSSRSALQIGAELTFLGDYSTAAHELESALNIEKKSKGENQNDTRIEYYLWLTTRRLAIVYELSGDAGKAASYSAQALAMMARLQASSPKDIGYNRNLAISEILLGQVLFKQKRFAQSKEHFKRAVELSRYVVETDPAYLESKTDLAQSYGNLGRSLFLLGSTKEGSDNLKRSMSLYEEICEIDVRNAASLRDYAETARWAADALERSDRDEAASFRQKSTRLWKQLNSEGHLSASDKLVAKQAIAFNGQLHDRWQS